MSEVKIAAVGQIDLAQARELAVLVDLEARWENLRHSRPRDSGGSVTPASLRTIQNAYAAFRVKLVAYNKRHKPAHVPELLLNNPSRLGAWCRAMRDLHVQVENDSDGLCPAPLLEKAYRCADRVSARMKKDSFSRAASPETIRVAIEELEALVQWCDDLAGPVATT